MFGWLDLSVLPSWALPFLGCQVILLAIPLIVGMYLILIFVVSCLTHLTLRLLGGLRESTEGFAGTFAVVCYANAAFAAQMIPLVGVSHGTP